MVEWCRIYSRKRVNPRQVRAVSQRDNNWNITDQEGPYHWQMSRNLVSLWKRYTVPSMTEIRLFRIRLPREVVFQIFWHRIKQSLQRNLNCLALLCRIISVIIGLCSPTRLQAKLTSMRATMETFTPTTVRPLVCPNRFLKRLFPQSMGLTVNNNPPILQGKQIWNNQLQ